MTEGVVGGKIQPNLFRMAARHTGAAPPALHRRMSVAASVPPPPDEAQAPACPAGEAAPAPPHHPAARDPGVLLAQTLAEWDHGCRHGRLGPDLWLFGYASLIWRPEFPSDEHRAATVHGWHRSLQMHSRVNRGTPQRPGLVFALLSGGSCRGMVYRVGRHRARDELCRLWDREMPNGVYDPRWLECRTAHGPVRALGFTLSRRSPAWAGALDEEQMLDILRQARGRFGTTLDYLVETARCLRERGIHDRQIERLMRLVRAGGLAA